MNTNANRANQSGSKNSPEQVLNRTIPFRVVREHLADMYGVDPDKVNEHAPDLIKRIIRWSDMSYRYENGMWMELCDSDTVSLSNITCAFGAVFGSFERFNNSVEIRTAPLCTAHALSDILSRADVPHSVLIINEDEAVVRVEQ